MESVVEVDVLNQRVNRRLWVLVAVLQKDCFLFFMFNLPFVAFISALLPG
jgi:hypothetical protein